MKYSYSKDIGLSFEEDEIKVRAALLNIGFCLLNAAYESIN